MTEADRYELRKRARRVAASWLRDRLGAPGAQDQVDELHGLTPEERAFVLQCVARIARGLSRLGGVR